MSNVTNIDIEHLIQVLKEIQNADIKCDSVEIEIKKDELTGNNKLIITPINLEEPKMSLSKRLLRNEVNDEKFDPENDVRDLFYNFLV